MPLWTDAYLGDTSHLTTIEHGAYLLLLIAMWRTSEKRLPNDDKMLARYARLSGQQWARMKPILMPFFRVGGGHITQGRLTDEANAVKQHSTRQSNKAKARWLKTKETTNAAAMPDECPTDASLTLPIPTVKEKREAKASPKKSHSRGSRLSPDWRLPVEWGQWAVGEGMPDADVRREADKFRDYWVSKSGAGGTKCDWLATWRNWIRNAEKPNNVTKINGRKSDAERLDDYLDEFAARVALQRPG